MDRNKNDYEHMLFYFAYKTFVTTADEIIEKYGMSRQHHRFLFFINKLPGITTVSYTHLTLPTTLHECRSRWSPYH